MSEVLRSNRFIISAEGIEIPPHNFKSYKLYSKDSQTLIDLELYNTSDYIFNPNNLSKITGISIEFLNAIGETINQINFTTQPYNIEHKGSYKDSGNTSITKISLIIK